MGTHLDDLDDDPSQGDIRGLERRVDGVASERRQGPFLVRGGGHRPGPFRLPPDDLAGDEPFERMVLRPASAAAVRRRQSEDQEDDEEGRSAA